MSDDNLCSHCRLEVHYGKGRRICQKCKSWCHFGRCALDTDPRKCSTAWCLSCLRAEPLRFIRRQASLVLEEENPSPWDLHSTMYVLWCYMFGLGGEGEASSKLGIGQGEIDVFLKNLRDNGFFDEDGSIRFEEEANEGPTEFSVYVVLVSLCANGLVTRELAEDLPAEGGPAPEPTSP